MTMNPDSETFASRVPDDRPVVARASATLDVDTSPLGAYAALDGESDYGFLLESAEKTPSSDPAGAFAPEGATADRHARYSFVGYDPEAVVSVSPDGATVESLGGRAAEFVSPGEGDALDVLRGALPDLPRVGFPEDTERQHLDGGLVGFLAYDAVYDLWLDEVGVERPETPLPDAQFVLTTRTLVFDHVEDSVELVFTPVVAPDDDPAAVYEELLAEAESVAATLAAATDLETDGFDQTDERAGSQADYEEAVRTAKRHVLDGDIYQGVVSRKRGGSGASSEPSRRRYTRWQILREARHTRDTAACYRIGPSVPFRSRTRARGRPRTGRTGRRRWVR